MEKQNNVISKETYDYYKSMIGITGYEGFIEKIKGKKLEDEYTKIDDCALHYIENFLTCDWGRSIVITYNEKEMDFIKSKYLSDYFKEGIRELLSDVMTKEIEDILNSDKDINQMDENEIKILYDAIHNYYNCHKDVKENVANYISSYLYKLDGTGVITFIKNNINNESIAKRILLTSGLNARSSFYSGRGVTYSDLNEKNLTEIFNKLLRLDKEYATNFIYMVCDMKTLGATEFIDSFISFANNNFKYEKTNKKESNISLNGVYEQDRYGVALGTIFSTVNRRSNTYQIEASNNMKKSFLLTIKEIITNMNIELKEEISDEYYYDWRKQYRRK